MGDGDFSGLQTVLVHDVLFGGEDEPDGFVLKRRVLLLIFVIIANKCLFGRRLFLLLLLRFYVSYEGR